MALKVKAVEKKIKFDKDPANHGVWHYEEGLLHGVCVAASLFFAPELNDLLLSVYAIVIGVRNRYQAQ